MMNPLFQKGATLLLVTSSLLLVGCSNKESEVSASSNNSGESTNGPANYPNIKTMVLDILHSKEGLATLKDTMSSPDFKQSTAVSATDVQKAVEKMVKSEDQKKTFLSQAMNDPKFSASMVEAAQPQLLQMQKQLMKDPEYQKELLALMKSPEYLQTQFDLLKSPEYRKEVMKIMTEALQQPTFRLLFMDSMKQAVQEAGGGQKAKMGTEKSKEKGKSGGGGESQGGEGESGDSGGEEESGG